MRRRSPETLVLALDFGTSAAKASVFDRAGRRVATARSALSIAHRPGGGVEQDPEEMVRAARSLLARIAAALPRSRELSCAGIASQRSTVIVWERATGIARGPAVCWMDRRAAGTIEPLAGAARDIARRSGLRLSPHYGAAHLARRFAQEPALARAAARGEVVAGPVASFLLARLGLGSGPAACDPTLAQRMLLFDPRRGAWDARLCELFGVPAASLPEVRPSAGSWGSLSIGGRLVPIHALAGDQQAAAAAFGSAREGAGGTSGGFVHYGTGAFVLWPARGSSAPIEGLLLSARADAAGAFYREGPVNAAGAALDAVASMLGRRSLTLPREDGPPLEPDEPLLVPAFAGLGAPHWDPQARAVLWGLAPRSTPSAAARAALAGIAHRVTDIVEAAAPADGPRGGLILSGPLAGLGGLARMQADLLGRPVRIAFEPEATLLGIARIAARHAGVPVPEAAPAGAPIAPRIGAALRRALRAEWARALAASRSR